MPQCPVCQSEYVESEVKSCSVCGWDLTPYPITFAGQIPEDFLKKERAKLAWAKEIWKRYKTQDFFVQSKQDIDSLRNQNSRLERKVSKLQEQVKQLKQEHLEKEQLQINLINANHRIAELTSLVAFERSKWQLPERPSETGVDFRKLEWLLILKNWEDADLETWILILQISGNDALRKEYITEKDIATLSINDLKTIDLLWTNYSNNQYGFSAQFKAVKIYKNKGFAFENPSDLGYYPAGYILKAIGIKGLGWILQKMTIHNVFPDI